MIVIETEAAVAAMPIPEEAAKQDGDKFWDEARECLLGALQRVIIARWPKEQIARTEDSVMMVADDYPFEITGDGQEAVERYAGYRWVHMKTRIWIYQPDSVVGG